MYLCASASPSGLCVCACVACVCVYARMCVCARARLGGGGGGVKLQSLVYDILPSRRKVPESDARSVCGLGGGGGGEFIATEAAEYHTATHTRFADGAVLAGVSQCLSRQVKLPTRRFHATEL